jgi:hypothetical protein
MRFSAPAQDSGAMVDCTRRGFAARAEQIGARFSRRTLVIVSIVSTALCLLSITAAFVLTLKVAALASKTPVAQPATATRAWLSPMSIHVERAPLRSDGKPRIDVTLNYLNVGREPARGVVVRMRSGTVPQTVSAEMLDAIYAGENTTCDSLVSPEKGGMAFPSSTAARSFSQTDIMSGEDMIDHRQGVLVVQACLKYQTADGAIHTTKLCQYVEPEADKPLDQRRMRACADGNDAN